MNSLVVCFLLFITSNGVDLRSLPASRRRGSISLVEMLVVFLDSIQWSRCFILDWLKESLLVPLTYPCFSFPLLIEVFLNQSRLLLNFESAAEEAEIPAEGFFVDPLGSGLLHVGAHAGHKGPFCCCRIFLTDRAPHRSLHFPECRRIRPIIIN